MMKQINVMAAIIAVGTILAIGGVAAGIQPVKADNNANVGNAAAGGSGVGVGIGGIAVAGAIGGSGSGNGVGNVGNGNTFTSAHANGFGLGIGAPGGSVNTGSSHSTSGCIICGS